MLEQVEGKEISSGEEIVEDKIRFESSGSRRSVDIF